jgi:glutamyl-tRNA synthetase
MSTENMDSADFKNLLKKYALANAVQHSGSAQAKSVLGLVLSEHPELRSRILQIKFEIERMVEEVNRMSPEKQKAELSSLGAPEPKKIIERKGLPDLERDDKFVVRFAPNPDGAIHLGNARPAILSDEYAKKYKGKFILRFDDTDPKVKTPELRFYKWIRDDLRWLGVKWHKEVISSKRLPIYYKHAEKLIRLGGAYVCTCNIDKWQHLRDQGRACPCRELDVKTQLKRWKDMLSHKYKEGQAVLRIKTDLEAKNPAVRDWPAVRIIDHPRHPLQKKKVWPLFNFASAIDDHLLGITHIMRGQEHSTNEVKQQYLYDKFKWKYPQVILLGRLSLSDAVLSKSEIRAGIESGDFRDWDSVKLGTIRALRRKGFTPEAIRQIITDIGPKPSDITISTENLSAYNRKIVDSTANRYFFVPDPKKIEVRGINIKSVKVPRHPAKKKGFRNFSLSKFFYIDKADFDKYYNLEVRLKDLCNIKLSEKAQFTGRENKSIPKIQWVPSKHLDVRVLMPDHELNGIGEMNILREKPGAVVQFERFGFVRLEKLGKQVTAIFTHD